MKDWLIERGWVAYHAFLSAFPGMLTTAIWALVLTYFGIEPRFALLVAAWTGGGASERSYRKMRNRRAAMLAERRAGA